MAYVSAEARQELNDAIGDVADELGRALALMAGAYEQLDELTGDRLEAELFKPLQAAYGQSKRTVAGFAARHGLTERTFAAADEVGGGAHVATKELIDRAVGVADAAAGKLGSLQDSTMVIEIGDAELRTALAELRSAVGVLRGRAREIERVLGR